MQENGDIEPFIYDIIWFSQPELMCDGHQLYSITDYHHLFVNCRCHVANKGYVAVGISNEAWKKVAKASKTNGSRLNPCMVEQPVLDPQSGATAELVFSERVQQCMEENGDINEANFCELIRLWHAAFDERGLGIARIGPLMKMRDWLLGHFVSTLSISPPVTSYVKDIPITTFCGMVLASERAIQLHGVVKGGSLNFRALGSNINETYFAGFRDLDPKGSGVLRPDELPRAMSVSCTLLQTRMDQQRYCTHFFFFFSYPY